MRGDVDEARSRGFVETGRHSRSGARGTAVGRSLRRPGRRPGTLRLPNAGARIAVTGPRRRREPGWPPRLCPGRRARRTRCCQLPRRFPLRPGPRCARSRAWPNPAPQRRPRWRRDPVDLVHAPLDPTDGGDGLRGRLSNAGDLAAELHRRALGLAGERLDLGGHDVEQGRHPLPHGIRRHLASRVQGLHDRGLECPGHVVVDLLPEGGDIDFEGDLQHAGRLRTASATGTPGRHPGRTPSGCRLPAGRGRCSETGAADV